jgi:hypothetical protein
LEGLPVITLLRFEEVDSTDLLSKVSDNFDVGLTATQTGTYESDYMIYKREGFYTVRYNVTDAAGNKAKEVIRYIDVIFNPSGISENAIENSLEVYPNPSRGVFTVSMEVPVATQMSIGIVNMLGEVIEHRDLGYSRGGTYNFDLSNYSSGIYFVRIQTESELIVRKLTLSK